jgi:hypothetical protein
VYLYQPTCANLESCTGFHSAVVKYPFDCFACILTANRDIPNSSEIKPFYVAISTTEESITDDRVCVVVIFSGGIEELDAICRCCRTQVWKPMLRVEITAMHCMQLLQKVTKAYGSVVIGIYAQSKRLQPIYPKTWRLEYGRT